MRHKEIPILTIILLLAFGLRLYHLGHKSIWYDEAVSYFVARLGIQGLKLAEVETTQPLYNILLSIWLNWASTSEAGIRGLSLLLGLLSIYAIYKVFRKLYGPELALSLAFLVAISPFHIWYSQEARPYTLFSLLTFLSIYYFLDFVEKGKKLSLLFFILSTTLNLYTHYYAVLVLFCSSIYLLVYGKEAKKPLWPKFAFALLIIICLYLPYILTATFRHLKLTPWQFTKFSLRSLYELTEEFSIFAPISFYPLNFLLLALAVIGLYSELKERSFFSFSVFFLSTYILCTYVISQFKPLYHPRFMIPILPFYLFLILKGTLSILRYKLSFTSLILLLAISYPLAFWKYENWNKKNDWRGLSTLIKKEKHASFKVLVYPYWTILPLLYYLPETQKDICKDLSQIKGEKPELIWLIVSYNYRRDKSFPSRISSFLEELGYLNVQKMQVYGIDLYKFSRSSLPLDTAP